MRSKRLHEILTPGVISVPPETTVSKALMTLRDKKISCLLVLEDKKPVGIFTERKVVQLAARQQADLDSYTISDLMTSPVLTADSNMDIYSAYDLLSTHKIRHLVVVDENSRLCGVVTQSNMMDHLGYEYFIEFKKISQVMTQSPFTVKQTDTVANALKEMARISTSCLIITEQNQPVGILTERDMTRLLIDNVDITTLLVNDAMSRPVFSSGIDLPLLEAAQLMKEKKIRRIVVVDDQGILAGLATQSDIIKGLQGQYLNNLKHLVIEKDRELENTSKKLQEKTVYLDNILRSSVDMGMVAAGLDYRIIYFNPAAEKILGMASTDVIGRDIREIHTHQGVPSERFDSVIKNVSYQEKYEFTFVQKKKDAPHFIKSMVSGIWDNDRQLVGFVFMLRDVTESTIAEKQIKKQKSDLEEINTELSALYTVSSKIARTIELSTLLDDVLNVISTIEIFNFIPQGGIFTLDNDQLQLVSQVGLSDSCLNRQQDKQDMDECICGRAVKSGEIMMISSAELKEAELADDATADHGAVIVPLKAKNEVVGVLCMYTPPDFVPLSADKRELLSAIGNQVGIAIENSTLYEQTKFLSLYDPLTGVANRRFMDIGFEKCFSAARRYGKPFSVIMLDIDNFKQYNDTHGHSAGDKLLVNVAKILLDDIRDADAIARYGGEEFLIMSPETPLDEACVTAERIRKNVESHTSVTISLGVSTYTSDIKKKEDLINKADEALYRAKKNGKNRVEF